VGKEDEGGVVPEGPRARDHRPFKGREAQHLDGPARPYRGSDEVQSVADDDEKHWARCSRLGGDRGRRTRRRALV